MAAGDGLRWLRAGIVGRPHGLDGSFHVSQANPQLLSIGTRVRVAGRELAIERRAGTDRRMILRLEGFADRSAAETLSGEEILVSRSQAPALGPDEWWREDLEGCTVTDAGRTVGVVRRLLGLPSCEVLEVSRTGARGDLLVPLISDAVRSVDVEHKRIEIDLRFLGEV